MIEGQSVKPCTSRANREFLDGEKQKARTRRAFCLLQGVQGP
ncbi:hypothetical protein ALQ95_102522 [Pseudomonas syringae pv. ribicola]|uniref:Uncharacterized protein n=1 Tax=Pseudomonas syringae pv. ribicola TaxID=55398 RepID=A0A3M2VSW6_PSESI|nr:hypothetical protein ALQ95_102522 [Pseudomonas syringae pv. ribicola]